jgi:uridine kinase
VKYFNECGKYDKVRLLNYRQKKYLTLYRLRDYQDYHHGFMVPSTRYLKWFKLIPTNGGFTIRFPNRQSPTEIGKMQDYPKLLSTFRRYGDWLNKLGISSVGALNDSIKKGRSQEIVLVSESFHEQHISEIALQIENSLKQTQVIIVAGPTSSGKTTFTKKLSVALLARGISPVSIAMDNYFVDREMTPLDEKGEYNYEDIGALDSRQLEIDLTNLMHGAEVQLPVYNFLKGKREKGDVLRLDKDEILILEGIHGLNPKLLPNLKEMKIYRIYVSALTQLNLDRNNRISTTDTRLIRRIIRDARERGYSAQKTIQMWASVRRGEKNNIFPFQENADIMFNSALVYEMSAMKPLVEPLLLQVPFKTPEYLETKRLLSLLEWFLPIESRIIPDDSLLREFIGDSILDNFKPWNRL